MARSCEEGTDRSLWLTLAQSWMRLAEHVERAQEESAAHEGALGAEPDQVA